MKQLTDHLEKFLDWGEVKKDITLLVISGIEKLVRLRICNYQLSLSAELEKGRVKSVCQSPNINLYYILN